MKFIYVEELLNDTKAGLSLKLIAGKNAVKRKKIEHFRIQKLGLVLTGFKKHLHKKRVQVFGNTEFSYLNSLSEERQKKTIEEICRANITVMVVTNNLLLPDFFVKLAEKFKLPILLTPLPSSDFINRVSNFLEERLAISTEMHGVLVEVLGLGILIIGRSGIGKSESALDLILRGHRLIADDVVIIQRRYPSTLVGKAGSLIKHYMEVRGLGLLNVKEMFGVSAVKDERIVELIIELTEWQPDMECDRLGLDDMTMEILGINIPLIRLPVSPGRNIGSIIEVAARNHALKQSGFHSAKKLQKKLKEEIAKNSQVKK